MKSYKPTYQTQRKKVFKTSEIAHIWAQQKLSEGRNPQGNLFFAGPSIWSYGSHFEAARFISADVVLITNRTYSVTTSKHMSDIRYAVNHKKSLEVPSFDNHDQNAQYFLTEIAQQVKTINGGRTSFKWRIENLKEMQLDALKFIALFKNQISTSLRKKLAKEANKEFFTPAQLKEFKAKEARNEEAQARARETKRANEDKAWKLREVTDQAYSIWGDEVDALNRKAWRDNDPRVKGMRFYSGPIVLRVNGDQIETSQGAFVPVAQASTLWALIQSKKPVHGYQIGHYTVTGIIDGNLVIGCHKIPCREVAKMAIKLGLTQTQLEVI